ncbi:hypothetical protein V1512DRAFT_268231 [Lipomyces arxii]|uniref:uncharacterized protein n=1 Tax=Lipomyces arxii TaxID=56418 RepID=UPI0034CFA909
MSVSAKTQVELLQLSNELSSAARAAAPEFTTVVSNRRRKAQSSKYKARPPPTASEHVASIKRMRAVIIQTKFYAVLKQYVMAVASDVTEIRCLALGRISETEISKWQTAVLDCLRAELGVQKVSCYDPDFVELDKEIMGLMNIEVTGEHVELVRSRTLYYMPHAPIFLVDRIMGEPEVKFVLGNDVSGYAERLQEEINLVYSSLRAAVDQIEDGRQDTWNRSRIDDGLAKNYSWWTSVNDLAMHWR